MKSGLYANIHAKQERIKLSHFPMKYLIYFLKDGWMQRNVWLWKS